MIFALPRLLRISRASEVYGLSILYLVLTASYLAEVLPWWAAIPLAPIAIQAPLPIMGAIILPRWNVHVTVHSRMLTTLMIAASLLVRSPLAWAFLALVAANAVAALVERR